MLFHLNFRKVLLATTTRKGVRWIKFWDRWNGVLILEEEYSFVRQGVATRQTAPYSSLEGDSSLGGGLDGLGGLGGL